MRSDPRANQTLDTKEFSMLAAGHTRGDIKNTTPSNKRTEGSKPQQDFWTSANGSKLVRLKCHILWFIVQIDGINKVHQIDCFWVMLHKNDMSGILVFPSLCNVSKASPILFTLSLMLLEIFWLLLFSSESFYPRAYVNLPFPTFFVTIRQCLNPWNI